MTSCLRMPDIGNESNQKEKTTQAKNSKQRMLARANRSFRGAWVTLAELAEGDFAVLETNEDVHFFISLRVR